MNRDDLQRLLDYHYWARDRVFDAVASVSVEQYTREVGGSFPSIRHTLVHMYRAEWAWHSRWQGHSPVSLQEAGEFEDVAALRAAWNELETKMRTMVEKAADEDFARSFAYALLSGLQGRSTFAEMIQHVVNHATYHRGQVTSLLRQVGAAPPKGTDLILFCRERQAT